MLKKRIHFNNYASQNDKLLESLVRYVYLQTNVAMLSSLFCASVIFVGLYDPEKNNHILLIWAIFFVTVSVSRIMIATFYKYQHKYQLKIKLNVWRALHIIGACLGGISWGMVGIFLFYTNVEQQTLIILMLAGVTAGVVPLSAAIPTSAILFLVCSLLPLIILIPLLNSHIYLLFDFALSLYLGYTIILTIKAYRIIKNSIILQFNNDILLKDLAITNQKLEHAATHDPLTQVANRRLFLSYLEDIIHESQRNNKMFALYYIDLDHFKSANDNYGHKAGDYILISVIERLKNFLRKEDVIARLGGDELAIIIKNVNEKEVGIVAKKLCGLIAMPITMNDITLNVSASIGISMYPNNGENADILLQHSDDSMYYVKKHGGNNFRFSYNLAHSS